MDSTERDKETEREQRERDYFDKTDFSDLIAQADVVETEVPREGLRHVLSVRLDAGDLRKLSMLAKAQGVGSTTMARMILRRALARPEQQLWFRRTPTSERAEEVEAGLGDRAYARYLISQDSIEEIREMVEALLTRIAEDAHTAPRLNPGDPLYEEAERLASGV